MQLPQLTKLYYSIGEVADMFHVAASVIRYWETEFPVLHPAKNSKGERKFTVKDIEILQQIYHLVKEKGFTIDGAKKELENQKMEKKEMSLLLKHLKELRKKAVDMRDGL
jgi:DNA-binding transcriptional MerR regulator